VKRAAIVQPINAHIKTTANHLRALLFPQVEAVNQKSGFISS
jgi:hypothetical protein